MASVQAREPAPIWVRTRQKQRPALTREAIVRAAIELADAEGIKAVSIRQVAARLDARTMTLYSHIDSKEDLLALMADEMAAELLIEGELPADWREAIGLICRRTRESLLARHWLVHLTSVNSQVGPNGLRHVEQSLAAVAPLGLAVAEAVQVITALDDYTIGHVIRETIGRRQSKDWDARRAYMAQLMSDGTFPHLSPVLELATLPDPVETFEHGLGWLLDGIERQYGGRRPRRDGDGGRR